MRERALRDKIKRLRQLKQKLVQAELALERPDNNPDLESVIRVVASVFGVHPDALRLKSREEWIACPRQVAMYVSRRVLVQTTLRIDDYFGFDHANVLHASRRVRNRMDVDEIFAARVRGAEEECRQLFLLKGIYESQRVD